MVWRKISTVFLRMYYVRVKGERNFWIFTVAKQFPLFFFGISKGISLLLATFPIPSFLADFFRENCGFLHTWRFKFSGRIRKLEKWIRIFFFKRGRKGK